MLVFGTILLLLAFSLYRASSIEIRSSRFALVDEENDYQSRLFDFFERFGQPNAPLFLIRGGEENDRQNTVDLLLNKLDAHDDFRGRALGKVDAGLVAETLFLHEPQQLKAFQESFESKKQFNETVEGGVPALLNVFSSRIESAMDDGDDEGGAEQGKDGFRLLDTFGKALSSGIQNEDGASVLKSMQLALASQQKTGDSQLANVDKGGYLVGRKGEHHIVTVFPSSSGTEMDDYRVVVEALRKIQESARTGLPEGVDILLTGLPVINVDEERVIQKGLLQSSAATGLGIFLLLLFAFRSVRQTLVALVPLGLGVGLSLGALALVYGYLNTITSCFMAVLMGLGIDFSVHLLARRDEFLRSGQNSEEATKGGILSAGPGIMTGAVTTGLAFLTVAVNEFTAFSEMGVITAIGLLLTFLSTMFGVPALLRLIRRGGAEKVGRLPPGLQRMTRTMRAAPKAVLMVGLLLAAFGAYRFSQQTFNGRYLDFLPSDLESSIAIDALEADGAMSPLFAFATAEGIEEAREMTAALRTKETVGDVHSVSDLLPPLDEGRLPALRSLFSEEGGDPNFDRLAKRQLELPALRGSIQRLVDALDEVEFALSQLGEGEGKKAKLEQVRSVRKTYTELAAKVKEKPKKAVASTKAFEKQLSEILGRAWRTAKSVANRGGYSIEDLPELFRLRSVARDGSEGVALFVYPERAIWRGGMAKRFAEDVESVDPRAAGHAISMHHHIEMILNGFKLASLYAAGLVFLVLLADFRKLSDVLLAMSPVLLGWHWMIVGMEAFGLELNTANIVVLPLILGIGIDSGVHMVHRARQSAELHGGVAQLDDLVRGTGAAVLLSSATTMVGFAGLTVADYGGMVSLGQLMILGLICCALASVVALPGMLLLLGRAR